MLTDTELLLCPSSSSIEWSVCWRGDHRQCGMGLFGSVQPFASPAITLSSVSVFLTPLTPAGGQETTVCDCGCRTVVSRERCDGNV